MKISSRTKKRLYDALLAALILTAAGSAAAIFARLAESRRQKEQMELLRAVMLDGAEDGADAAPWGWGETAVPGGPQGEGPGAEGAAGDSRDGARGEAGAESPGKAAGEAETREARARRHRGYARLKEQNQDMAGWVRIEGSRVDYPVMQSADRPDFYLSHGFDKGRSRYGLPYAAESCSLDGDCRNIVIYGHHMKDGSMFAGLMKYEDRSYWEAHPVVQFDTLEKAGDYRIIGVVKETALPAGAYLFDAARAEDKRQFEDYVGQIRKKSLYDTGVTAAWGDSLITLVTCEYSRKEGRLLVVAKKIQESSPGE